MNAFQRLRRAIENYVREMYGFDQLNGVLLVLAAVLLAFAGNGNLVLRIIALLVLAVVLFRVFSLDHEARTNENLKFLDFVKQPSSIFKNLRTRWENRDTKAYVRCPNCHKQFALPKGKGKLRATCPYCGEKSVHKV